MVYHYAPSRGRTVPLDLLEEFKGYLHCDDYQAYDVLASKLAITLVACWYHVRRKFKEAQKVSPKDGLATQAIQVIKKLALIEEKVRMYLSEKGRRFTQLCQPNQSSIFNLPSK